MGLHEPTDQAISKTRQAARAVLLDDMGRVGIMYFTTTGSFKLAGGGIDEGEDVIDALRREVREEAGYAITDIQELGIVEERRYFCGIRQLSHCYLVRVTDFVGADLTDGEAAEGMELRWVDSLQDAVDCIEQANNLAKGEPRAGLEMMKARETAILRVADNLVD